MKKYQLIGEIADFDFHSDLWDFCGPKSLKAFLADLKVGEKAVIEINSPGGLVMSGIEMANAIKNSKAHLIAHVTGIAASMASVIACACDEIQMEEASFLMIHDPWTYAEGNAEQLRKDAAFLDQCKAVCMSFYRGKFDCDEEKLAALMSAETWYTGRECLENGLKCSVVASDMKAAAKIGSRQFGKMPEAAAKLYEFRQMDDATKAEIEKVKAEQTAAAAGSGEGSDQAEVNQDRAAGSIPKESGQGSAQAESGAPAAETQTATEPRKTPPESKGAQPGEARAEISEPSNPSPVNDTKSAEDSQWEARFKGASKKINELQDAIKAHEATIAELRSQIETAGKDLAAANAKVSELAGTIEKQAQDLKAKENDLADVRNSLAKANEHVKHLEETRNLLTGGVLSLPEDSAKVDVDSGKTPEAREELRKKIQAKKNKLKK